MQIQAAEHCLQSIEIQVQFAARSMVDLPPARLHHLIASYTLSSMPASTSARAVVSPPPLEGPAPPTAPGTSPLSSLRRCTSSICVDNGTRWSSEAAAGKRAHHQCQGRGDAPAADALEEIRSSGVGRSADRSRDRITCRAGQGRAGQGRAGQGRAAAAAAHAPASPRCPRPAGVSRGWACPGLHKGGGSAGGGG